MLTDTQWLLAALRSLLTDAHIADRVEAFAGLNVEEALRQLHDFPSTSIIILPESLTMQHDLQGGFPVKALLTRQLSLIISAAEPGRPGGDMSAASALLDKVLATITWQTLGQDSMLVMPTHATAQQLYFDDVPGRAVWLLSVDVSHTLNSF